MRTTVRSGGVKTAQAAFGKLKSAVATATREHKQAVNAHVAAEALDRGAHDV